MSQALLNITAVSLITFIYLFSTCVRSFNDEMCLEAQIRRGATLFLDQLERLGWHNCIVRIGANEPRD